MLLSVAPLLGAQERAGFSPLGRLEEFSLEEAALRCGLNCAHVALSHLRPGANATEALRGRMDGAGGGAYTTSDAFLSLKSALEAAGLYTVATEFSFQELHESRRPAIVYLPPPRSRKVGHFLYSYSDARDRLWLVDPPAMPWRPGAQLPEGRFVMLLLSATPMDGTPLGATLLPGSLAFGIGFVTAMLAFLVSRRRRKA